MRKAGGFQRVLILSAAWTKFHEIVANGASMSLAKIQTLYTAEIVEKTFFGQFFVRCVALI